MEQYYINKKSHEVHRASCGILKYWFKLSYKRNYKPLGPHPHCRSAMSMAKKSFDSKADGCGNCCPSQNKKNNGALILELAKKRRT